MKKVDRFRSRQTMNVMGAKHPLILGVTIQHGQEEDILYFIEESGVSDLKGLFSPRSFRFFHIKLNVGVWDFPTNCCLVNTVSFDLDVVNVR